MREDIGVIQHFLIGLDRKQLASLYIDSQFYPLSLLQCHELRLQSNVTCQAHTFQTFTFDMPWTYKEYIKIKNTKN